MENRVDFHRFRELQSIRLSADSFNDRIRTETFPIQLFRGTLSGDILGEKPDFVANGKFDALVLGVVITGLLILSGFYIFDQIVVM